MATLSYQRGRWMNLEKPGGAVFFVSGGTAALHGGGGSNSGACDTPEEPATTIQAALDKTVAGRGDTVVILPGSITITAALTMTKDDVTLTGLGGSSPIKPSAILVNAAVDGIAVTGANVVIEDLHFAASTASVTSRINAGSAGLTVRNNTFDCGGSDTFSITIPAAGLHTTISGNRFYITADGPDAGIRIEAAGAHYVNILDNVFHGMNDSNSWDLGAIYSTVAHLDCVVSGNVSTFGLAIIFTAAATGMISLNTMGEGTLAGMLDPGSCMCSENYEADAIDQTTRVFPTTAAS